jgi:murein DD-endopeptidase MepM/ murein hydrolase activator NlpD
MRAFVESFRSRGSLQLVLVALLASGLAACSTDATRFNEGALSNPYAARGAPANDSVAAAPGQSAPVRHVEARPLPPPNGAYAPARSDVTGTVPGESSRNWDWNGGTAITVAPGDTIASIAQRHHVPPAVIMQANGIRPGSPLPPGQRLVIPRYHQGAGPHVAANAGPAAPGFHVVAAGENLSSIARHYHKPRTAIAKANNLPPDAKIRIGQHLVIPGLKPAVAAAPPKQAPPVAQGDRGNAKAAAKPMAPPAAPGQKIATNEPPATAHMTSPTEPTIESESGAGAEPTNGNPSFRWPVRGRIITGFGPRANGPQSDGIDLAVPEGTSVKAAEDGVVAYAGNELKGYGNLVLVRHQNGYVTAYAHASELMVKRGDQVKRGQIIARAGQTGAVSAPQLHFEIRKGKVPVDPVQFLPST